MVKAFVFGKFLPFHKGHEAMISFALTQCDFLSVLVCCDKEETIPGDVRKGWIESTFAGVKNIEVKVLHYDSRLLPNTSETSARVSEIWSVEFKKHYPNYNLLITSEPYGELVADFMGIHHIAFDLTKGRHPISASVIRNDLFANWHYLPAAVKPYFAIKVAILGTESTGKTTLTEQLAKHFNCSDVLEAGRELIPDSTRFTFEDLHLVANEHAKRIDEAILSDSPLIIIDTDIHITKSYAKFTFDRELPVQDHIYLTNMADLYLYLNNDAPYYQDGNRLSKVDRDLLDRSHRDILIDHQITFVEISGTWQNRFEQAVSEVSKLITNKAIP
ncbi:AAA family ATPase [Mucilaginibacter pocheonensis]|uniref:HTH-type transcriptional repressor of NAD biosynthesis genes n=1 Tax=Mucilaginibacter pocheonensis TaxID=398050 RepID=A0ABU1TI30_9SPHI|nr:AAA family ATPase [Mucilaginibacter pocheonensis]MDR6945070.1 HTH-type transcriptional repressor of NAD biosynthesis genes [Mucilaginibacter pocheonensis]